MPEQATYFIQSRAQEPLYYESLRREFLTRLFKLDAKLLEANPPFYVHLNSKELTEGEFLQIETDSPYRSCCISLEEIDFYLYQYRGKYPIPMQDDPLHRCLEPGGYFYEFHVTNCPDKSLPHDPFRITK